MCGAVGLSYVRPHFCITKIRPVATHVVCSVDCAKTDEPIMIRFGRQTLVGPRNHVLERGAHWRHLANMVERSVCNITSAMCFISYFSLSCRAAAGILPQDGWGQG